MSDISMSIGKVETPKLYSQLGVLVMDGSSSMTERAGENITKAQAANNATRELFTRFKVSRVAKHFSFAVVTFDTDDRTKMPPTQTGPELDDNGDYDPLIGHGGGTRIYRALEQADHMVNEFIRTATTEDVPCSAVILLMSDGRCDNPAKTREVAAAIKSGENGGKVTLCTTLFATIGKSDAAGEALLRDIATDPVMGYKTVYDSATLRHCFAPAMWSTNLIT
jgi:uncharacterized protein YegL